MKDYIDMFHFENNEEKKNNFILKYKVISEIRGISDPNNDKSSPTSLLDKKIIIYYANGDKYCVEYSSEKEMQILNKMKEQFLECQKLFDKKIKEENVEVIGRNGFIGILLIISFIIIASALITSFFTSANILGQIIGGLVSLCFLKCGIKHMKKSKKRQKMVDDFEKSKLFIENEEIINKRINQDVSNNVIDNVNYDTFIKLKPFENKINLNSIDKLTLEEMKKLLLNVQREMYLSKEDDLVESKKLVKK